MDWVGASVYTYGISFPWSDNYEAPPGKFIQLFNYGNYYQRYCVEKQKPMSISETAAAFHTNTPKGPGVGELATKQSWWRQYITNKEFWQQFPKIKLVCMFEFTKNEECNSPWAYFIVFDEARTQPSNRDFKISNKTEIREAFNRDLEPVKSHYIFGDSEYLMEEARKRGVRFDGGGSNPGSAAGGLPPASDGERIQALVSTIVVVIVSFLAGSYLRAK